MTYYGGKLYRFAQDCWPVYGQRVNAFEIVSLSRDSYHEQPAGKGPVLAPAMQPWDSHGMHHLDVLPYADGCRACVDGWHYQAASGQKVRGWGRARG